VAGTGGSVTITPAGVRNASGGIVLIASGPGSAARFTVSGNATTYSIALPGTGALTGPGGKSMAIGTFTSTPSGIGTLAGGNQIVTVGATLTVTSQQAPGSYSGAFIIQVDYN